jgi:hypothetical protein
MSANFSGSTVLGLSLGRHPEALFVGEPALIHRRRADGTFRHRKFCARCGDEAPCPLWTSAAIDSIREAGPGAHLDLPVIAPAPVVIDGSKDLDWIGALCAARPIDAHVVHLTKPIERYAASARKMQPGADLARLGSYWAMLNRQVPQRARELGLAYHHVDYVEFASSPASVVGAVWKALDLTDEVDPTWELPHYVKGNPGVASTVKSTMDDGSASDLHIALDEKWRQILADRDVDALYSSRAVRTLSAELGYDHPGTHRTRRLGVGFLIDTQCQIRRLDNLRRRR